MSGLFLDRAGVLSRPRSDRRTHSTPLFVVLAALLTFFAPAAHALTPLNGLRFSPDITVNLGGTTVTPENVAQDDLAGTVSLVNVGVLPFGTSVTAYHRLNGGDQLLAFDTTVSLVGGVTARPGDVVRFNGATYTLEFDATAEGVPLGVNTDAVGLVNGGDLLLSFDTTVTLGAVTADKEDLVHFDGAVFTMFFDASAAGVPPGVDLDAVDHLDQNGHLLLSFDTSGVVGGVAFDKEDVLEFDPGTGVWEMAYDADMQYSDWPPANLVALGSSAPLVQPTPTAQPTAQRPVIPPPTPTKTPIPLCDPAPRDDCHTGGASSLLVRSGVMLDWKFKGTLAASELGDPVDGGTQVGLCVYDESGGMPSLAARAAVEPGGECAGEKPCWRRSKNAFVYRDRGLRQEGVDRIRLRSDGARFIIASPRDLPRPVSSEQLFRQDTRVIAQLVNSGGSCWEAVYTPENVRKNLPAVYRARKR
jgi:hypothetical protein